MIIDGHAHLGKYWEFACTDEEMVKRMDKAGVDKAVVFSLCEEVDNDYVLEAVKKFPDRLIGFATVNPRDVEAVDEFKRLINQGFRGLKLHPNLHGFPLSDHRAVDPLFEICDEYKIPVLAHGGDDLFSHPFEFGEMARTFPTVVIIMAHSGFMWTCNEARIVAKRHPNVFLDTAAVFPGEVALNAKEVGAEKVIMGTDAPVGSFELELHKMRIALPDKRKRDLVTGGNLMKILGLKE